MSFDPARADVDRDCRRGEQIVAWALITHPGAAVAGSPEREVRRGIVVARDPHRAAAGLPLVARRPSVAARFARRWHRVGFPHFLAFIDRIRRDEPSDTELAA